MKEEKTNIDKVARRLINFFREKERIASQQEKDDLWHEIEHKVKVDKKSRRLRFIITAAASAAVIFSIIWIGKDKLFVPQVDHIKNIANSISTETEDILLVLSDDEQINIKSDSIVTYSKSGTISLQSETYETNTEKQKADEIEYNQIIVPKGKRIQVILSDESKLWVNSGTKVVYPRNFTEKKREIFVDGEVYLEVKHNKKVPFIVKTNQFDVQVLGTSFNICTYKSMESSVVLVNGLVDVKDYKGKKSELKPSQRIVIDENGLGEKKTVDTYEYTGWINNLLVLKSQPLNEVFEKLHLYYDINFDLEESVKNMPLSGKLDLKDNIEDIIKSISKTAPITYYKDNNKIVIKEK
ncbi:MAG: FecR family protein [Prevotella sp.]|jgi:hypothetical protein|nr:FecR family protein [Prevotella sp.]